MTPSVDDFHALARSSPWLWTTLHFVHRSGYAGDCEAWVRRPGRLLVRTPDGQEHSVSGLPYSTSTLSVASFTGVVIPDPDATPGLAPVVPAPPDPTSRVPQDVEPPRRPDGLVAERPDSWDLDYDDPMYGNYSWVAMLDPVELSHHVSVSGLRVDEVNGRPAWRASLEALPGYSPRCGGNCCELLYSEVGRICEVEDPADAYIKPGADYPDHYDVVLDVQTGVVVRCLPVGGDPDASWLENDILEVDADLDALFA